MIAVECPRCGAPTPAFPLAPEVVRCRACGFHGSPHPQVVEQVRAAAAQLGLANAQHARHLGAAQARAVQRLLGNRRTLHWILVVLIVPLGSCAGCSVLMVGGQDPELGLALLFGLPMIFFAAAALLASRKLSAQVREIADACAAVPPTTPGEPAACHLCGGPLPPATNQSPIVRCRHCSADNVASPEVLTDVVQRRSWVVGQYGQTLGRRAAILATQGSAAVAFTLLAGLGAPFAGCVTAFALESQLDEVPLEPLPHTYVLVSAAGRTCVARVRDDVPAAPGSVTLSAFGGLGGASEQAHFDGPDLPRRTGQSFLGQWLVTWSPQDPKKGAAKELFVHVLRPRKNQVKLVDETGQVTRQPLDGLCLVAPSGPAPTTVWRQLPATDAGAPPAQAPSTGPSPHPTSSAPRGGR